MIPAGQLDAAMAGPRRMAQQVGLEYLPLPVRDAGEIGAVLSSLTPVREHVLLVNTDPLMYVNYGSTAIWLRTVQKVDQVLRGQPVGEIPFEQPTRIILTLNRETAKSIGLTFSQELLLRADEVIG